MDKYVCTICGYVYDPAVETPITGFLRDQLRSLARRLGLPAGARPKSDFEKQE